MRSSNIIYDIGEGRPIWKTLPIRIGVTVLAVVVLVVSAVIVVVSGPVARQVGDTLGLGDTSVLVWNILKWPVLVVLISLLLAVLFWASPNAKQGRDQVGQSRGSGGRADGARGLGLVRSLRRQLLLVRQDVWSLAGVVIFLIWLWLTNIAILLGAEINAELDHGKAIEEGLPEDVAPFALPRDTKKLSQREQREQKDVEKADAAGQSEHP